MQFTICDFGFDDVKEFIEHNCRWRYKPLLNPVCIESAFLPVRRGSALPSRGYFFHPYFNKNIVMFTTELSDNWDSLLYSICVSSEKLIGYTSFKISDEPLMYEMYQNYPGSNDRVVRLMSDDGRLDFYQNGAPLNFEKIDMYKNRRKIQRISKDLLFNYAENLGVSIFDNDIYITSGVSLEIKEGWSSGS